MNNDTYNYKFHKSQFKKKCFLCNSKISKTDLENEDYFVLFRGHTPNCFYGAICFSCYETMLELSENEGD